MKNWTGFIYIITLLSHKFDYFPLGLAAFSLVSVALPLELTGPPLVSAMLPLVLAAPSLVTVTFPHELTYFPYKKHSTVEDFWGAKNQPSAPPVIPVTLIPIAYQPLIQFLRLPIHILIDLKQFLIPFHIFRVRRERFIYLQKRIRTTLQ